MESKNKEALRKARVALSEQARERASKYRKAIHLINHSLIREVEMTFKGKFWQSVVANGDLYKPCIDDDTEELLLVYIGEYVQELTIDEFLMRYEEQV